MNVQQPANTSSVPNLGRVRQQNEKLHANDKSSAPAVEGSNENERGFMDKVGDAARKAGEKTGDMLHKAAVKTGIKKPEKDATDLAEQARVNQMNVQDQSAFRTSAAPKVREGGVSDDMTDKAEMARDKNLTNANYEGIHRV